MFPKVCAPLGQASAPVRIPGLGIVVRSYQEMNYFSDSNWCAAKGYTPASIEEYQLPALKAAFGSGIFWPGQKPKSTTGRCKAGATSLESERFVSSNFGDQHPVICLVMPDTERACNNATDCDPNEACDEEEHHCYCPDNHYITSTGCTPCPEGQVSAGPNVTSCLQTCTSNSQCGEEEFCNLNNCSENNCSSGVCQPIGGYQYADVNGLSNEVILSDNSMNWYAAQNWCSKNGKQLITINSFSCYQYGNYLIGSSVTAVAAQCCSQNHSCSNWDSYWDDNEIISSYETLVQTNYSAILTRLRQMYGKVTAWTNSYYNPGRSPYRYYLTTSAALAAGASPVAQYRALCK